jgi:CheY-like chemotaxis protein
MGLDSIKLVSGGQTGADRAALDFAKEHGVPHGGWCSKGRRAEDGPIESRYQLQETPSVGYLQGTECNVQQSDGTVIFSIGEHLSGESLDTLNFAQQHEKPWIYLPAARNEDAPRRLWKFIEDNHIQVLNVAGPTAREEPEVGRFVTATLHRLFHPPLIYLVQDRTMAEALNAEIERKIRPQCKVRAFSDPKQALQSLESEIRKPDLLITGFLFRGMNGAELLHECKKLKPSLKVIIYAITPQIYIERCLEHSPFRPDSYVSKMILLDPEWTNPDPIWAAIEELLRFKWPSD